MKRLWLCAVTLLSVLYLPAGEPSSQPVLRIETGVHSASINDVSVDAAGRFLATASWDKTLRIWDLASGSLISTLRPPLGGGNEGALYACALSPDGALVAAGGWSGYEWDESYAFYVFDRATGRLLRRVSGLSGIVIHLEFSKDGQRIAASLGARGIRIYRTSDGRELARDEDYPDASHGCDFDQAGRLVATCLDGSVCLYSTEGKRLGKVQVGNHPAGVRFSPDGSRIALKIMDQLRDGRIVENPIVQVRSASDLSLLLAPDVKEMFWDVTAVAWSADGRTLYAAGHHFRNREFPSNIRSWTDSGRGPWEDHTIDLDGVFGLAPLPDGRLVWGSGSSSWGILGGASHVGEIAHFKYWAEGFALDPPGSRIAFSYEPSGKRPASFDVASRRLEIGPAAGLLPPKSSSSNVQFSFGRIELDGHPLPMAPNEKGRGLALGPEGEMLFATGWNLYAFDAKGVQRWKRPAPGSAYASNISSNGKLGVAAYGDGTIRWHRMSDGQELLAFFPHADQKRWVLWTPSGYYDCSPGAEDLIGWHINRGKDQAADFFPASRFRATCFRPDIVSKVLETADEGAAIAAANRESGNRVEAVAIEALAPPVVRVLSPEFGAKISQGTVTVKATVRHPKGLAIDAVWAAVDGRRVDLRGLRPQQDQGGERTYTLEVPVPSQDCIVSVFAQSGAAVSEAASVRLAWVSPRIEAATPDTLQVPAFVVQPKLYVLAVGVGTYRNPDFRLDYPAKDARDFTVALQDQKTRLYRDVEVRLLTDAEATRDAVLEGLEWLERQTTAKDVAVLFLAGHGINDPTGAYFFLPWNADPERMKTTMIPSTDFQSTLAKLPGKVLLFLDSCHSGNVVKVKLRGATDPNRFINELSSAESGVVVFSASTGRQGSQESPEWGNGAFTKAVVEGLSGKADFQHTGRVTLNMLDLYISERVKELTKGTQSPTTAKPNTVQDFPLAVVK